MFVTDGHSRLAEEPSRLLVHGQEDPSGIDGDQTHRDLANDGV
jgi:hypothetical protein